MERILKNGKRYYFYQVGSKVYADCFYCGKWNRVALEFDNLAEANVWCNDEDYKYDHPSKWEAAVPPSDYYDDTRRYFGD